MVEKVFKLDEEEYDVYMELKESIKEEVEKGIDLGLKEERFDLRYGVFMFGLLIGAIVVFLIIFFTKGVECL